MYGAIGALGTAAVVVLSVRGSALLGALAFGASVLAMTGFALLTHGVIP